MAMAPPKARDRLAESLRQVPEFADGSEPRALPPGFGPDHLRRCEPGTLGAAYLRLMRDFDLDPESLPTLHTSNDLTYFRRRVMESHDIWQVIADCPADIEGELGVVGFYFGHFARYLSGPTGTYNAVIGMNLAAGLLHVSRTRPRRLLPIVTRVLRNVYRGYLAAPLFSLHGEQMWGQPVTELLPDDAARAAMPANDAPRLVVH